MKIIGILGPHSNSGKTTLICKLLPLLPGKWGAIKCATLKVENKPVLDRFYPQAEKEGFGIVDDSEVIFQEGKDTHRMAMSGACEVLWIISDSSKEAREKAWEAFQNRPGFSEKEGWLIEGYSFIETVPVDVLFFCLDPRRNLADWKRGTLEKMKRATGIFLLHPFGEEGIHREMLAEKFSPESLPPVFEMALLEDSREGSRIVDELLDFGGK